MSSAKAPAPDVSGRPRCFSLSYTAASALCRRCAWSPTCSTHSAALRAVPTLMQRLTEAEHLLRSASRGDVRTIYRDLFQEHYGKPPSDLEVFGTEYRWCFDRVQRLCETAGIDVAHYIRAQMLAMRMLLEANWASGLGVQGFKPNMMVGERAKNRYNVRTEIAQRVFKAADVEVFEEDTELSRVVEEGADEEARLLRLFVLGRRQGAVETFAEVAVKLDAEESWRALTGIGLNMQVRRAAMDLRVRFEDRFVPMTNVVYLRGATTVAMEYDSNLAYRIGFKPPFSRDAFASLIARLYPHEERVRHQLDPKLGKEW